MTPPDGPNRHASVSSAPSVSSSGPASVRAADDQPTSHASGRDALSSDVGVTADAQAQASSQARARPPPPGQDVNGKIGETAGDSCNPASANTSGHRHEGDDEETYEQPMLYTREVLRLFQCYVCKKPLSEPVTLPCGSTICKPCIPKPHLRRRISYPATGDRLERFTCPFKTCAKEHALGDCGVDVVLNKLTDHVRNEIERRRSAPAILLPTPLSKTNSPQDDAAETGPRADAGQSAANVNIIPAADNLAALWEKAERGSLDPGFADADADTDASDPHNSIVEPESVRRIQKLTRAEVDCQVCYALFYDPLTTGCGHTFCRSCLHRILDHSRCCPICRRSLSISPLLSRFACPPNRGLAKIIETLWKGELDVRRDTITSDEAARAEDLDTPLFLCTLAFPQMPTFLHVFEPQYRLMIRRAMEGNRIFGMVLAEPQRRPGDLGFSHLGTLLRIQNAHFYSDGRCLIETIGLSRFRVLRHGFVDGYAVSKVERVDDISLEEEETTEATEVANAPQPDLDDLLDVSPVPDPDSAPRVDDIDRLRFSTVAGLDCMTTHDLLVFAGTFVARMQSQSVPWMTAQVLSIYGECPYDDPVVFPWWLGSVLPIKDSEKYKLLGSSSVRQRLKLCCKWIIEWESRSWSFTACSIL